MRIRRSDGNQRHEPEMNISSLLHPQSIECIDAIGRILYKAGWHTIHPSKLLSNPFMHHRDESAANFPRAFFEFVRNTEARNKHSCSLPLLGDNLQNFCPEGAAKLFWSQLQATDTRSTVVVAIVGTNDVNGKARLAKLPGYTARRVVDMPFELLNI